MKQYYLKKQAGMTFMGFVIVAAFLISIVMAGIIVVPDYVEYFGVKKIIQHIGSEPNFADMTKTDIVTMFDKGASAGYVTVVKGSDLLITKDADGRQVITAEYQVVRHLAFNLSALMDFKATTAK
ncbi:MAG: DUF4845 domain-containing protein [Methylophilaceae bacterium]